MLRFEFGGHLRRHFGDVDLNVSNIAEGLRLLMGQSISFRRDFTQSKMHIRINNEKIHPDNISFHFKRKIPDTTITFTPVVEGAITAAAAAWIAIGLTVASIALSLYTLFTMPNMDAADANESNKITNSSFGNVDNRIGQGRPVPILLGEMVVGSNVLSLGIDTTNNTDWDNSIS